MDKEHIEQEEYSHSSNEYRTRMDDYNLNVKEFKFVLENNSQQEFGSQPQSEFNEYVQQVSIKPKKSKFRKMMQYLVAGVAGAVIITNTAVKFPENFVYNTDATVMPVEYEVYTYKVEGGSNYVIYFDESKIDDFCNYVTEMVYQTAQNISEEEISRLLNNNDEDEVRHQCQNTYFFHNTQLDFYKSQTNMGEFWYGEDGEKHLASGYFFAWVGSGLYWKTLYAVENPNYKLTMSDFDFDVSCYVEIATWDDRINCLDVIVDTYSGKSKEFVRNEITSIIYEAYENNNLHTYREELILEQEQGTTILHLPTFLKIEKIS